jgi:predicted MPP superfamily phosphohydrolase
LCHSPDEAIWAAQNGAQLIFSGHVHGGQIRIPLIGPVIMPSRYGRRFDSGWFRIGKSLLHVSCGLGGSQPVRWCCPPEVTMITLKGSGHDQSC